MGLAGGDIGGIDPGMGGPSAVTPSYVAPLDSYTGFGDMFDGGGPGRPGPTFEGGGLLSELANGIGIKPHGYKARMASGGYGQAAPQEPMYGPASYGGGNGGGGSYSTKNEEAPPPAPVGKPKVSPLDLLQSMAQQRGERMAMGMPSPAELAAGGLPRAAAPNPGHAYGPQQRFQVDPYSADELSRMLDEWQRSGNPNSMAGF